MSLTAVHPERGRLDATLPDLGCGWGWEAIHRVRPPAPLNCPECGHGVRAKLSPRRLRFFAHAPGSSTCALAEESMAHHLLKLELAAAARTVGWMAELEVNGPGRTWRADVLASAADGRRIALEAQLAPISPDDITRRTERMAADGVRSCWFSDRIRIPWLGVVPSVRLVRREAGLVAVEPLARFTLARGWSPETPLPLPRFLDCLLTGRLTSHTPCALTAAYGGAATVWTTAASVQTEDEHIERRGRQERLLAEQEERSERRGWVRREAADLERLARTDPSRAALARHSARLPGIEQAMTELSDRYHTPITVGWSVGDSRYACGIPLVNGHGAVVAVYDPLPQPAPGLAFLLGLSLPLVFPTEERRERFDRCRP